MTNNIQSNDNCVLTDAELDSVSGGDFLSEMAPTNGDDPVVQTVMNVATYTYRMEHYFGGFGGGVGTCHC